MVHKVVYFHFTFSRCNYYYLKIVHFQKKTVSCQNDSARLVIMTLRLVAEHNRFIVEKRKCTFFKMAEKAHVGNGRKHQVKLCLSTPK